MSFRDGAGDEGLSIRSWVQVRVNVISLGIGGNCCWLGWVPDRGGRNNPNFGSFSSSEYGGDGGGLYWVGGTPSSNPSTAFHFGIANSRRDIAVLQHSSQFIKLKEFVSDKDKPSWVLWGRPCEKEASGVHYIWSLSLWSYDKEECRVVSLTRYDLSGWDNATISCLEIWSCIMTWERNILIGVLLSRSPVVW